MSKPKPVKEPPGKTSSGVSRRTFLKGMGLSSAGVVAISGDGLVGRLRAAGILPPDRLIGPGAIEVEFIINGKKMKSTIEPRTTLADVLREKLGLTGTKIGCNRGACGACTVILAGQSVCSCMTLAIDAVGQPIETIEGLSGNGALHPLQDAFIEHDALQCGFCTSGMIMSAKHLLDTRPSPTKEQIRKGVSGNLCRCGTYPHVLQAVESAAKKK